MAFNIGELFASLDFDATDFMAGIDKTVQSFHGTVEEISGGLDNAFDLSKSLGGFDKAASVLKDAGTNLTLGITAPMVAAGGASLKFASDFELGMRKVTSLISDVTEDDFKKLSDQTLELSQRMGIDAVEASHALYEAISAGVPKENAIDFVEVASKAAIAGVTETATAVNGLTTVLQAYGLDMSKAKDVSDAMFQSVNIGKLTFPQLADAIGLAAGTGKLLGVSYQELLAAGATLTLTTGQGVNEAMTMLQSSMKALIEPTKGMSALLEKMGYSSGVTAIQTLGLEGTLQGLEKAAGGNVAVFESAFGRIEGFRGAVGLSGDNAKKAAEQLEQMQHAADGVGASTAAYNEINKSFSRQSDIILNQLKEISIEFGNALLPAFTSLAQIGKQYIIPFLSDAVKWFTSLPSGIQTTAVAIAGLVAAIGPLLVIGGTLIGSIGSIANAALGVYKVAGSLAEAFGTVKFAIANDLTGALTGGEAALAGLFELLGPIAWAITAVAAAWGLWQLEPVRNAVKGLWDVIQGFWTSTLSPFIDGVIAVGAAFVTAAGQIIGAGLQEAWAGLSAAGSVLFGWLVKLYEEGLAPLGKAIAGVLGAFSPLLDILYEVGKVIATLAIAELAVEWKIFTTVIDLVWDALKGLAGFVGSVVLSAFRGLAEIAGNIAAGFQATLKPALESVSEHFKTMTDGLTGGWGQVKQVWQAFSTWVSSVWTAWLGVVDSVIDNILKPAVQWVEGAWDKVYALWTDKWNGLSQWLSGVWEDVVSVWDNVKDLWAAAWGSAWNGLSNIWNAISELWSSAVDPIATKASTLWDNIASYFSGVWAGIAKSLSSVWLAILDMANSVWDAVNAKFKEFLDWASKIPGVSNVFASVKIAMEQTADANNKFASAVAESAKRIDELADSSKGATTATTQAGKATDGLSDSHKKLATSVTATGKALTGTNTGLTNQKQQAKDAKTAADALTKATGALADSEKQHADQSRALNTTILSVKDAEGLLTIARYAATEADKRSSDARQALNDLIKSGVATTPQLTAATKNLADADAYAKIASDNFKNATSDLSDAHKKAKADADALTKTFDEMTAAVARSTAGLEPNLMSLGDVGAALARIPPPALTASEAMKQLGITTTASLEDSAEAADAAYAAISQDANSSSGEIQQAWDKSMQAQIAYQQSIGNKDTADALQRQVDAHKSATGQVQGAWQNMATQVSTVITNFAQDISKSLWDGDMSWGEKGKSLLKSLGQAVTSSFLEPATAAITKFMTGALADLIGGKGFGGLGSLLDTLGTQISNIFKGGGGLLGTGIGVATSTAGGAAGTAASTASTAASGASGVSSIASTLSSFSNIFNMVTGGISAITGVLGLFGVGQGGQKDREDIIANNTSFLAWCYDTGGFRVALLNMDHIVEAFVLPTLQTISAILDGYLYPAVDQMRNDIAGLRGSFDAMRASDYPQITSLLTDIRSATMAIRDAGSSSGGGNGSVNILGPVIGLPQFAGMVATEIAQNVSGQGIPATA